SGGIGDGRSAGHPMAMAVHGAGNVLIAGGFNGQVTFGSFTLSDANGNGFLAKLDPNGNYLWAENMGAGANGVAVDSAGDPYITGTMGSQATFGSITVTLPAGGVGPFAAKADPNGTFLWADGMGQTKVNGYQYAQGVSIAVDGNGNAYVGGNYYGTYDFDPSAGSYVLSSIKRRGGYPSQDVVVEKLNANGGTFSGTVDFDPGAGTTNLTSAGGKDAFVLKLSNAGAFLNAVDMGGAADDSVNALAVDPLGDIYATGFFQLTASFGSTTLTS